MTGAARTHAHRLHTHTDTDREAASATAICSHSDYSDKAGWAIGIRSPTVHVCLYFANTSPNFSFL